MSAPVVGGRFCVGGGVEGPASGSIKQQPAAGPELPDTRASALEATRAGFVVPLRSVFTCRPSSSSPASCHRDLELCPSRLL